MRNACATSWPWLLCRGFATGFVSRRGKAQKHPPPLIVIARKRSKVATLFFLTGRGVEVLKTPVALARQFHLTAQLEDQAYYHELVSLPRSSS